MVKAGTICNAETGNYSLSGKDDNLITDDGKSQKKGGNDKMENTGKAIVKVVFKDGQEMHLQVKDYGTKWSTEYYAFDGLESIMHKIEEILFVRSI